MHRSKVVFDCTRHPQNPSCSCAAFHMDSAESVATSCSFWQQHVQKTCDLAMHGNGAICTARLFPFFCSCLPFQASLPEHVVIESKPDSQVDDLR